MKVPFLKSRQLLSWSVVMLFVLTFTASCKKDDKSSTATTEDPMGIPPLFQRTGELATATEWQKTISKVDELKARIAKDPSDIKARLQIATIYMAEARITGEHPYYYPAVLKILDGVLSIDPVNFEATTFKASVKLSQHQFAEARELGEKARQINPDNAYVYGVLVDANVELGNYEEAVAMSDKMQALKPSLESYSRASYLREIYGNYDSSIEAMKMAVDAGLPGSEPYCWSKNTLAHLYVLTGQLDKAEREYYEILAIRPSYAFAMGGKAKVQELRKQYDQALVTLEKASAILPEYSFQEQMADIYALQGNKEKAAKHYNETATMLDDDAQSGHAVDLEMAKLYAKKGQLDSAAVYAQKEYGRRPKNIDVNQTLAMIALQKDDLKKAQEYMKVAMRTGIKNPEMLQLASKIEMALGNDAEGKKLLAEARKVNPDMTL